MAEGHVVPLIRPVVVPEAVEAAVRVLRGDWIGQGPVVGAFEDGLARAVGAPAAVAVNSGAAAVRLALAIAGVGPGDDVVTTPLTCTATNHPILEQHARPVFADVQSETGNLDPDAVARCFTPRTRAILCAHWGGYPADLDELHRVAAERGVPVIEDATEGLGARYRGRWIGAVSRFTAFAFGVPQVLTSVEGGMLAVLEPADAAAARRRRWFGIDRAGRRPAADGYYDFDVTEPGYGYHMTDVTAAIGLAHLERLESLLARRRAIVDRYRTALASVTGLRLFAHASDRASGCGLFTVHVERRADFHRVMRERGVETSVVHVRNDRYAVFGGRRSDLPVLDAFEPTYICLPLHNRMTDADVEQVISAVRQGW